MRERISIRSIEVMLTEAIHERVTICDTETRGFRAVVSPTGSVSYFLRYRIGGVWRCPRIATWPEVKPEAARARAKAMLAEVVAGRDPEGAAAAPRTVAEAWALYYAELVDRPAARKTLSTYRNRWNRHLAPTLGRLILTRVKRQDVLALQRSIAATAEADMVAQLAAQLFAWCCDPDRAWLTVNPAQKLAPRHRKAPKRAIDAAGTERLGAALREAMGDPDVRHRRAALLLLLLVFTGARVSEWRLARVDQLGPQFRDADWRPLWLEVPDPKEAVPKRLHLGEVASRVVLEALRLKGVSPWLFPSAGNLGRPMAEPYPRAREIFGRAGVPWRGFHACRHTLASAAAAIGLSDKQTGSLLGHRSEATTAIYTSIGDERRVQLATLTQDEMARRLLGKG